MNRLMRSILFVGILCSVGLSYHSSASAKSNKSQERAAGNANRSIQKAVKDTGRTSGNRKGGLLKHCIKTSQKLAICL